MVSDWQTRYYLPRSYFNLAVYIAANQLKLRCPQADYNSRPTFFCHYVRRTVEPRPDGLGLHRRWNFGAEYNKAFTLPFSQPRYSTPKSSRSIRTKNPLGAVRTSLPASSMRYPISSRVSLLMMNCTDGAISM